MTSRIINHHGNVEEVSDHCIIADARKVSAADFARSLGLNIRTPEQKQAEWNTEVERYVSLILSGCEFSEYGNPCVIEAKKRIAAEQLTETIGDPLLKDRRAA